MPIKLDKVLDDMTEERRLRVQLMAQEMLAEMNLRDVRRLRKMTQARLSRKLKIGQEGVSRIEKRTDLYISTLRSYVEAVGGKLNLVVELPDRAPVFLTGLGDNDIRKRPKKKTENGAPSKPRSSRAA